MLGWHHLFDGREFEQAPGNNEGQGSLACCSPWGHKELDMTKQLNNNSRIKTELKCATSDLAHKNLPRGLLSFPVPQLEGNDVGFLENARATSWKGSGSVGHHIESQLTGLLMNEK